MDYTKHIAVMRHALGIITLHAHSSPLDKSSVRTYTMYEYARGEAALLGASTTIYYGLLNAMMETEDYGSAPDKSWYAVAVAMVQSLGVYAAEIPMQL